MAAVTPSVKGEMTRNGQVLRFYGTGAADTIAALTTTAVRVGDTYRLSYFTAVYSDTPTQAGVTMGIDNGLGAAYDVTLTTGSANATTTVYIPSNNIYILPGDAFVITAPAAGGTITCAITVVVEVV